MISATNVARLVPQKALEVASMVDLTATSLASAVGILDAAAPKASGAARAFTEVGFDDMSRLTDLLDTAIANGERVIHEAADPTLAGSVLADVTNLGTLLGEVRGASLATSILHAKTSMTELRTPIHMLTEQNLRSNADLWRAVADDVSSAAQRLAGDTHAAPA